MVKVLIYAQLGEREPSPLLLAAGVRRKHSHRELFEIRSQEGGCWQETRVSTLPRRPQ